MEGTVEERMARMEGILDQMDKRLTKVEAEIKELREAMREGFQRLEERFETRFQRLDQRLDQLSAQMLSMIKRIVAGLIGMWATIMGVLIALVFK